MKFKNKFAEDHYNQSVIDNEKTRRYPELKDLHRRWFELLNDEESVLVISEQGFENSYGYLAEYYYKDKIYYSYQSKVNNKVYIVGKFTEPNEFDNNKRKFQCIWTNMFEE